MTKSDEQDQNQGALEYFVSASEKHIKIEKNKARELRASQWWKNQLGLGICYYCKNKFSSAALTMDHMIPIVRGGKSSKSNVVVSCKECNSKKKYLTPVEMTMAAMPKISNPTED
jgi:5-methylcytosine-specific restriction protein A